MPQAWEQYRTKGYMVVTDVFSPQLIRWHSFYSKLIFHSDLIYGTFEKTTSTGRTTKSWPGSIGVLKTIGQSLIIREGKDFVTSASKLKSSTGRYDLKLPPFVVDQLSLPVYLEPILIHLREIMIQTPPPILRTHNIVKVPMKFSIDQNWHYDHPFEEHAIKQSYFTLLIPLNSIDKDCGGTEIWHELSNKREIVSVFL